jgi:hypothetical protein
MIREPMGGWFVWQKNGRRPNYKHDTYESAATEAQRLAKEHVGKKFIVLQMVAKFHEPAEASVVYDFTEEMVG